MLFYSASAGVTWRYSPYTHANDKLNFGEPQIPGSVRVTRRGYLVLLLSMLWMHDKCTKAAEIYNALIIGYCSTLVASLALLLPPPPLPPLFEVRAYILPIVFSNVLRLHFFHAQEIP